MIPTKLLHWSFILRNRPFPGRFFLGRLYRFFLFWFIDPFLGLIYRARLSFKEKKLSPFALSDYQLLKTLRHQYPVPTSILRWVETLSLKNDTPNRYRELLSQLHTIKSRTETGGWLLPETALLSPELNCKGFAVLLSSLLSALEIKNELWIGLPADGKGGHVWVVLETNPGRIAVDQFNGHGVEEPLFLLRHRYAMTFKI